MSGECICGGGGRCPGIGMGGGGPYGGGRGPGTPRFPCISGCPPAPQPYQCKHANQYEALESGELSKPNEEDSLISDVICSNLKRAVMFFWIK